MSLYITVDCGTTNTRVSLIRDGRLVDGVRTDTGARKSIGGNGQLKTAIKNAIAELLARNCLVEKDVVSVLASGMITSEYGLCRLDHLEAPVGIRELHDGLEKMQLPEITDIPFAFIRGVKITSEDFEGFDVMRGEETELMGIMNEAWGECIYLLPGSHSKIVEVNPDGRIVDFRSTLTGEMIGALATETILKDAVNLSCADFDSEYLLMGYDYAQKEGMNRALFKTRILKTYCSKTEREVYSFFLGVTLSGEIAQIIASRPKTVVIGGQEQMKNAIAEILRYRSDKKVIVLDKEAVNLSTAVGAIRIFERRYGRLADG